MKHCTNCGSPIADDAIFCETCGTKQNTNSQEANSSTQTYQYSPINPPKPKKKGKLKCFISIVIIILLVAIIVPCIKSCSTPETLEDVAKEFADALFIDASGDRTIAVMSQELIDHYYDELNISSKDELIYYLNEIGKEFKAFNRGYYGEDWYAKVTKVDITEVKNNLAEVVVTISHHGSEALWETNIDEISIYLSQEDDKWRVVYFES